VGLLLGDPRRVDETKRSDHEGSNPGALAGDVDKWVVDIEVDDEVAAQPVLARLFPDGIPATLSWTSNRGKHWLFQGSERLAKYCNTVIKGSARYPDYPGIEIRIGTWDATQPAQTQSVIPPSLKEDGSARQWTEGPQDILLLPDSVYRDLDLYALPTPPTIKAITGPDTRNATGGNGAATPAQLKPSAHHYNRREILDHITASPDRLLEVLRELNIRLTGRMSSKGWLVCHAFDREDTHASAGISPDGVYYDHTTQTKLSLFDLAVATRPDLYTDWRDAVNRLGNHYLPNGQQTEVEEATETASERRLRLAREGAGGDPRRLANATVCEVVDSCGHPVVAHFAEQWWEHVGVAHGGPAWRASPSWDRVGLMNLLNAEADRVHARQVAEYQQQILSNGQSQNQGKGGKQTKPQRLNTSRLIGDVKAQLYPLLSVGLWKEPTRPFWTSPEIGDPPADNIIGVQNGLLDITDPTAPRLLLPTPRYFSPVCLPFAWDPTAPRPAVFLDRLLAYQWQDDPESVACLQEWFGYCLTPGVDLQKMLLLQGQPASGKGTIAWVLRRLLGAANCSEVDSKAISDSHGTSNLPGKLLITFSDSRTADSSDNIALLQFLLTVVGGDPIPINPKGLRRYTAQLMAKVMMVCNQMPYLRDSTGAMDRRYLLLQTPREVPEAERDERLSELLLLELPGILLWAMEGRARLLARRRFVQPQSALPALEQARAEANHLIEFIEEWCKLGAGLQVGAEPIREAYSDWCSKRGQREYAPTTFGRCLKDAARALGVVVQKERRHHPQDHNRKFSMYTGIDLIDYRVRV
jgi:P4 family phage/plasmid primase-like protien